MAKSEVLVVVFIDMFIFRYMTIEPIFAEIKAIKYLTMTFKVEVMAKIDPNLTK